MDEGVVELSAPGRFVHEPAIDEFVQALCERGLGPTPDVTDDVARKTLSDERRDFCDGPCVIAQAFQSLRHEAPNRGALSRPVFPVLDQMTQQQRIPRAGCVQRGGRLGFEGPHDAREILDVGNRQRANRERSSDSRDTGFVTGAAQRMMPRSLILAIRRDDENGREGQPRAQKRECRNGGLLGPVEVFEQEQQRPRPGERGQCSLQRAEEPDLLLCRIDGRRRS